MQLGAMYFIWSDAIQSMFDGADPQFVAYHLTELLGLVIGIITCLAAVKRHPEIAWFSIAVVIISLGSGPLQGIQRYILGAPAVFVTLAHWGRNPVFDRAWTILSILLVGLLSMLYAFNMWVA